MKNEKISVYLQGHPWNADVQAVSAMADGMAE